MVPGTSRLHFQAIAFYLYLPDSQVDKWSLAFFLLLSFKKVKSLLVIGIVLFGTLSFTVVQLSRSESRLLESELLHSCPASTAYIHLAVTNKNKDANQTRNGILL